MPPSPVMALLACGVPVTLLLDLLDPGGPDSAAINALERPADDPIWHDAVDLRVIARSGTRHAG